jgi:hypothetical protein
MLQLTWWTRWTWREKRPEILSMDVRKNAPTLPKALTRSLWRRRFPRSRRSPSRWCSPRQWHPPRLTLLWKVLILWSCERWIKMSGNY